MVHAENADTQPPPQVAAYDEAVEVTTNQDWDEAYVESNKPDDIVGSNIDGTQQQVRKKKPFMTTKASFMLIIALMPNIILFLR
jgi:hypothetical protein